LTREMLSTSQARLSAAANGQQSAGSNMLRVPKRVNQVSRMRLDPLHYTRAGRVHAAKP
jgi:hypothetical protein